MNEDLVREPVSAPPRLAVDGLCFDLSDEDWADFALQRTEPLIAMRAGDALGRWFADGDRTAIISFLRRPRVTESFARMVVQAVDRELAELQRHLDFSKIRRLASIGPGLGIFELKLYRMQPCRLYLIDIEHSDEHRHGFHRSGSGYSSNATARAFLEENGVPASDLAFCNPRTQPLDHSQVDLILSNISMGFHYPVDDYVPYITSALPLGGTLVFDKRKGVADAGWDTLAPKFHERAALDFEKYRKLICERRLP